MATIVTVHGTFASGPLEGSKWWQRGSPFAVYLDHLVEGSDGPLKVEPHIWNGFNSEASRRAAGEQLAGRLATLDATGEPYVVIGHSHGGSVVSAALLHAAKKRNALSAMRGWFTIGTPFIKTERQRFLFQRLHIFGKAIYLTLLTFMVLGALAMGYEAEGRPPVDWAKALFVFALPLFLFYTTFRVLEMRRSVRFNKPLLRFAEENFADRWLSLWHAKDEAVQSLKAVKRLDVQIFSRDFAASTLNLLAIVIIPILCIWTLTSETAMDAIAAHLFPIIDAVGDDIYSAGGTNIFENAIVLLIALLVIPATVLVPGFVFDDPSVLAQTGMLILGLAVLIGMAMCLTWIFNFLARLVSHGLSLVLNPMTLAQLKAVAYGSDVQEDLAVDASEWPIWLSRGYPPLPPQVADNLELASDQAIGQAIPKFRNIVGNLTAAETPESTSDVLADYLTWQELIHTTYFEDERFAQLLAYAICQCDGFRPTPAFKSDPAYAESANAFAAIVNAAYIDK
jgi:pimeloyl-ACP methyl ester carboxylesterase